MLSYTEKGTTALKQEYLLELDDGESTIFHPENMGEIIFVLSGQIILHCLDKSKDFLLESNQGLFLQPRGRGMTIRSISYSQVRIIKIDPIITKRICSGMISMNHGIFRLEINESLRAFEVWLTGTLDISRLIESRLQSSPILQESLQQIGLRKGQISIKELYESLGVSKSTLEQHFLKVIGLSPKEYSKIQKLNHFIHCQKEYPERSLTELAYHCGYYDQSHLIKDFQYFMQTSPRKYFVTMAAKQSVKISA